MLETETFDPRDLEIAKRNGALVDLQPGERVVDGSGDCGENAPIYVWLRYGDAGGLLRIPNAELRRV